MSSGAHLSLRKHRPGPHIPGLLHPKLEKSSDWVFLWQGPYDGSVGADRNYLQGCGQLSYVSSSTIKQDPSGVRALGLKSFMFSAGQRGYHGNSLILSPSQLRPRRVGGLKDPSYGLEPCLMLQAPHDSDSSCVGTFPVAQASSGLSSWLPFLLGLRHFT